MLEQFEQEFMDKEEVINPGLHDQTKSSNLDWYNSLTPEILENFIMELIDNEDKGELTLDDVKDQLNEDGSFTEIGLDQLRKELFNPMNKGKYKHEWSDLELIDYFEQACSRIDTTTKLE